MLTESFLVDPVSIGIEFCFGNFFIKGNGMERTDLTGLSPGVALYLKAFKRTVEGEVTEDGMREFMKE